MLDPLSNKGYRSGSLGLKCSVLRIRGSSASQDRLLGCSMEKQHITFSLIIPTFRRVKDLKRCLKSINSLNYEFEQVIVVVRNNDIETLDFLHQHQISYVLVYRPGTIAALKCGIAISNCKIIVTIDDDTEVDDNWIQRAIHIFEDPNVGAVGGRDIQPNNNNPTNLNKVGRFTLRGKLIGNHHLSSGGIREVDFLKGCNMFIRRDLLGTIYPVLELLKGEGAQWGNDLVISLASRLNGKKTIFDSNMKIIHHASLRPQELREPTDGKLRYENTFNAWLIKTIYAYKFSVLIVCIYGVLVGDRMSPGLLKSIQLRKCNIKFIVTDLVITVKALIEVLPHISKYRRPLKMK